MINELDEIEKPDNRIIEDDDALDKWYKSYRASILKRLKKHHKNMDTPNIDYDIPEPRRGYVFGGKK